MMAPVINSVKAPLGGQPAIGWKGLARKAPPVLIRLEDIPPEGREVAFCDKLLGPQDLGTQVVGVIEAPTARLRIQRSGERVLVKGEFETGLRLVCSRCLRKMEFTAQGPVDLVFLPQPAGGEDELHLAQEDMEVCFYQGGIIDLGQALRDEINLAVPMAPVCRPDCPGICPVCGRSPKDGPCGCAKSAPDPRWAKLKEFKAP